MSIQSLALLFFYFLLIFYHLNSTSLNKCLGLAHKSSTLSDLFSLQRCHVDISYIRPLLQHWMYTEKFSAAVSHHGNMPSPKMPVNVSIDSKSMVDIALFQSQTTTSMLRSLRLLLRTTSSNCQFSSDQNKRGGHSQGDLEMSKSVGSELRATPCPKVIIPIKLLYVSLYKFYTILHSHLSNTMEIQGRKS